MTTKLILRLLEGKLIFVHAVAIATLLLVWNRVSQAAEMTSGPTPYANSLTPLPSGYSGPTFALSHSYPKSLPNPAPPMPWLDTLNGKPISIDTAAAYTEALKKAVEADMRLLVGNYPAWNADQRGWYDQPWLAAIRDPIHGMFIATATDSRLFNDPTLKVSNVSNICDFVAVYYNATAAVTLGRFWGDTAMHPAITNTSAAQFPEGSLIVKLAFTEAKASDWPILSEAPSWTIYSTFMDEATGDAVSSNSLFDVHLLQIDVIVKDTKAAPKTGWVFSTLVYDNRIHGDFWERMIPLGAMWGNDPDVHSSEAPGTRVPLKETWINPASPPYALATLGWGGRLSGPNDLAVQGISSYIDPATGSKGTVPVANSSCMSCHSPAQWQFKSFLLPGHTANHLYYMSAPNSSDWMRWFQDRAGTEPMNAGEVALDYDLMFAFKALPAWATATGGKIQDLDLFMRPNAMLLKKQFSAKTMERNYNGLPFKSDK